MTTAPSGRAGAGESTCRRRHARRHAGRAGVRRDDAAKRLPALIGHDIPRQIVKAGRRLDLHPVPADLGAIRERALAR